MPAPASKMPAIRGSSAVLAQPLTTPPMESRRMLGQGTREEIVRGRDCAALPERGIAEVAMVRAGPFYAVARPSFPLAIVVVCSGGDGVVRLGAQSFAMGAGQVLLIPAEPPHEFRSGPAGWEFSTIWYEPGELDLTEPSLARFHAQPFAALMHALIAEFVADADPGVLRTLAGLVDDRVRRLANPVTRADVLGPVWAEVVRDPGRDWSVERLSALAGISAEQLRRVSHRETGRSPMEQVARLRVQRGATLLATTNDPVERIAEMVGYAGVRAFRSAFVRHLGTTPKEKRLESRRSFTARADRGGTLGPRLQEPPLSKNRGSVAAYAGTRGVQTWRHLKLDEVVNTAFAEGSQPWFGQPLEHVRPGVKTIHGVPFVVREDGCVLLKSARIAHAGDGRPLPTAIKLRAPRKVKRLYFLHACGWGSRPGAFARYRVLFADGSAEELPLVTLGIAHPEEAEGKVANIQDWYFSYEHISLEHARPYDLKPKADPTATSQFLYTLEWVNAKTARAVAGVVVEALPGADATLALLAVTVEPGR